MLSRNMQQDILKGKSILLISPKFFGYEIAIKEKLSEMGAEVFFVDDRPGNGLISKGLIRINKNILAAQIIKYYNEVSLEISHKKFDIIFLLNPEALPISFLEMCKVLWKDAKYVMYMWDSIKNRKHTLDFLPFCDRVFTFDMDDAKLPNFSFKPLFYLDIYTNIRRSTSTIKYDICFMGTLHSDRYAIAKEIRDWCTVQGLKAFFYFFGQSPILYYFKFLLQNNTIAPRSEVSFSKLNSFEVSQIVASSRVVLDIQHPKQTGLTIRTLETIGAGKKLITTNQQISQYDFYTQENVMIIDRCNPIKSLELSFFLNNPQDVEDKIITNYSIGNWLLDLLL